MLGDMVRYTVAPIISWAILPALLRKLFAALSRGTSGMAFLPPKWSGQSS